jgi:DNA-directed RNA polymerase subunit H (RpoH/RPB5)
MAGSKYSNILKRYRLKGFNQPKRTPDHPTKSHIVAAKEGDKVKIIRFGEQGA